MSVRSRARYAHLLLIASAEAAGLLQRRLAADVKVFDHLQCMLPHFSVILERHTGCFDHESVICLHCGEGYVEFYRFVEQEAHAFPVLAYECDARFYYAVRVVKRQFVS